MLAAAGVPAIVFAMLFGYVAAIRTRQNASTRVQGLLPCGLTYAETGGAAHENKGQGIFKETEWRDLKIGKIASSPEANGMLPQDPMEATDIAADLSIRRAQAFYLLYADIDRYLRARRSFCSFIKDIHPGDIVALNPRKPINCDSANLGVANWKFGTRRIHNPYYVGWAKCARSLRLPSPFLTKLEWDMYKANQRQR